jgi:hypothetical protein
MGDLALQPLLSPSSGSRAIVGSLRLRAAYGAALI